MRRHQFSGVIVVILPIVFPVGRFAFAGQVDGLDVHIPAHLVKIVLQVFVTADEIHDHGAVQVDEVVALPFDGGVDVVLIRPLRVEFPLQEACKVVYAAHEVGAFPADVVEGAELQIPRVADEGEFIELIEKFLGQHFPGGDGFGVAGEFAADAVAGEVAEFAANELGEIPGVAPAQMIQGGTDAGAAGFGNVNEQEVVFVG